MIFEGADHHCDREAEWDAVEITDPGEMIERRGVCQECGRVMYEQYDVSRLQDALTGEMILARE